MRQDGRESTQLRPPCVQFRTIPKAHGSAEFGLGDDKYIACVYGPINKALRRDITDRARIEVLYRSSCSRATPKERSHELQIKRYLESLIDVRQYPKATIRVVVHPTIPLLKEVVSSNALNSAFCACLDAGIAMRTTSIAITLGVLADGNELVVDPEEDEDLGAIMTVGVEKNALTFVQQTSYLSPSRWKEAEDLALRAAQVLEAFLRIALKEYLK